MVVQSRRTHVRFMGDKFYRKRLVEVLFQPDDGFRDAAGMTIRLCHSLKLLTLLATPQAVKNLPVQQRCEYSTVLRLSEELEQSHYRIEQFRRHSAEENTAIRFRRPLDLAGGPKRRYLFYVEVQAHPEEWLCFRGRRDSSRDR